MANYFNTLPLRLQLEQLGVCEFMDQAEFEMVYCSLKEKK
jgi:ketol-acid reductoisomerase